jgi:hypothetical protein
MSRPEEDPDRIIRQALEEDESEALGGLDDPSKAELLTEIFRGRHRRLAIGGAVVNLMLLVGTLYSAVQFIRTEDVREMLLWGACAFLCFGMLTAIKVWYWLEMTRLAVTRDVKRLELQVSRLAERIRDMPR